MVRIHSVRGLPQGFPSDHRMDQKYIVAVRWKMDGVHRSKQVSFFGSQHPILSPGPKAEAVDVDNRSECRKHDPGFKPLQLPAPGMWHTERTTDPFEFEKEDVPVMVVDYLPDEDPGGGYAEIRLLQDMGPDFPEGDEIRVNPKHVTFDAWDTDPWGRNLR